MEPQTLVFFGIVGSGKGTQIKLLREFLEQKDGRECVYAYPGNEYRRLTSTENYTGSLIKESLSQGNLQPDFLTDAIVTSIFMQSLTADKHVIADGYPRTLPQAETFETMMKFYKRSNVKIVYIELGREEAMKRNLLRGRHDDTKEGIEQRFNEYVNKVVPAMHYFKGKEGYTVYEINGEQSIEKVHEDIRKALGC